MVGKMGVILLCVFVSIAYVTATPALPRTKQELVDSFVEFLREDKQFGTMLEKLNAENSVMRHRRQAEEVDSVDTTEMEPPKDEGGFFDRAARFVMEVLQRFLKWINSDS